MDEEKTPEEGSTKKHKPVPPFVAARRRSRQIAIAAVIRNARRARHMVQEELAEASGISKGHIGRLESTKGATTYDLTLLRMWDILDALGMTWAEWERECRIAMSGGSLAPPTKRDEDVALLARVVRTLPDDMVSILLDLARTLERHQVGLLNVPPAVDASWVREAEDAARRVGMEQIDEALGTKEKGRESKQDRERQA